MGAVSMNDIEIVADCFFDDFPVLGNMKRIVWGISWDLYNFNSADLDRFSSFAG